MPKRLPNFDGQGEKGRVRREKLEAAYAKACTTPLEFLGHTLHLADRKIKDDERAQRRIAWREHDAQHPGTP